MQRRKNFIGIILTIIFVFCLSGCTKKNIDVESTLRENSKKSSSMIETSSNIHLNIEKRTDRFLVYPDGHEDEFLTMFIPCNWYDKIEFEVPEMESEEQMPKLQKRFFNEAKQIALDYIESSNIIRAEDKEKCEKAIEEVTLHYGSFVGNDYVDIPMMTSGNHVYVNRDLKDYLTVYPYLHELIHVISNTTNEGSEFECVMYRSTKVNEAITDLITVELLREYEVPGYEISAYTTYYEGAYYMMDRFDMLETYFYSDGYDEIINEIGRDQLDLYFLLIDNLGDGKSEYVIFYVLNEWYK